LSFLYNLHDIYICTDVAYQKKVIIIKANVLLSQT